MLMNRQRCSSFAVSTECFFVLLCKFHQHISFFLFKLELEVWKILKCILVLQIQKDLMFSGNFVITVGVGLNGQTFGMEGYHTKTMCVFDTVFTTEMCIDV